jgi:hypothetical protein
LKIVVQLAKVPKAEKTSLFCDHGGRRTVQVQYSAAISDSTKLEKYFRKYYQFQKVTWQWQKSLRAVGRFDSGTSLQYT